jgi:hypothetical protein
MEQSAVSSRLFHWSLASALSVAACSRPATPGASPDGTAAGGGTASGGTASGGAASAPTAPSSKPGALAETAVPEFANRVWKVAKGSTGDPGTYYVFLSDGSMLIASPHGTPSLASWHYSGEVLTMVEEGLPHPATVLQSTPDTLAIRIVGSGEPVEMTFVPGSEK